MTENYWMTGSQSLLFSLCVSCPRCWWCGSRWALGLRATPTCDSFALRQYLLWRGSATRKKEKMLPMNSKGRGRQKPETSSSTLFRTLTIFFAVLFFAIYAVGVCYFAFYYGEAGASSLPASQQQQQQQGLLRASKTPTVGSTPPVSVSQPPKSNPSKTTITPSSSSSSSSSLPPPYPTAPLSAALRSAGADWWLQTNIIIKSPSPSNSVLPSPLPSHYTSFISSNAISTQGVIVLGMHRSSTSLLSGLLSQGHGYPVGPSNQLIAPASDNEKGFFELLPVVLQNDDLMRAQARDYGNVDSYDVRRSLLDALSAGSGLDSGGKPWHRASPTAKSPNPVNFNKGSKALAIYKGLPVWLQKDPRMCVTFPAWFPFFVSPPAVVFTYRDPLEVAMSMNKREPVVFPIWRVLELWLYYNRYALQAADGLCTVYTDSARINGDTFKEVERVGEELRNVCGAGVEQKLRRDVVDTFVDPSLQHNKHAEKEGGESKAVSVEGKRGCKWAKFTSTVPRENDRRHEEDLYNKSMQVYCDLNFGVVYKDVWAYDWPL